MRFRAASLLALMFSLQACWGWNQFDPIPGSDPDGSADTSTADVRSTLDVTPRMDAASEIAMDVRVDVPVDTSPEARADVRIDAVADNATRDTTSDAVTTDVLDARIDAVSVDAIVDVLRTDVATDVIADITCGTGLRPCGTTCVNTNTDPLNCGRCVHACADPTPTCRFGNCTP